MARQVKFALSKLTSHQPLAIVSEPAVENTCQECMAKQALEWACLAEVGHWFTQANQTPCFQPPLWEIFGTLGIHQQAFDKVLDGTFLLQDTCNQYTKKVLQHLWQPLDVPEISLPTLEEYIYRWRHAWEETSSLYSTIHFGHYMAGMQEEHIACFNAQMAIIPAAMGHSPNCWQHGLNVMLEKNPGNINVEHLRIILLFEANCNQNNKWLSCTFMKVAENLMAEEQYGSHQFKDAITQCLNKKLCYDYIQWKQQPAALCSNDAKN